ncbi:MAG: hypothetical protein ABIT37_24675 [Luteolibacter sp.]
MIRRSIPLLFFCLAAVSCEKAKNLADQAKAAVENKISGKVAEAKESKPDAGLQKLVDQTPEGVIFRKDLPFPNHIEVLTTLREEMSVRSYRTSAIEHHAEDVKGTKIVITKLERAGDQVRYSLEQSSFAAPQPEGSNAPKQAVKDQLKQVAPAGKPMIYQKSGRAWQGSGSDGFRAAALSKQLSPVFELLLVENALAPRTLWLGKRRFKAGDKVPVAESSLPMLLTGKATGSFNLTFEKTEAVDGHPCGVFAVTGDFSRKQFPDFEGTLTDQDVTIESGKIWLSLLYPIVLRQELDTIQTTKTGGQGGTSERGQGKVKVTLERSWKIKS